MADLVVDSQHGRRSLIEVPPMQPVYQRDDLPDVSRPNPQDHDGTYVSQRKGIPVYPHQNWAVPREYERPPVTYHRSEEAVPVHMCQCCHGRRHDTSNPQRFKEVLNHRNEYAGLHYLPGREPNGYYSYTTQRHNYPVQETYPHHHPSLYHSVPYQRPTSQQIPQYQPQYHDLPPKPKSAHYFYGPDGELLPGPLDAHKYPDPPKKRIRHSIQREREGGPKSESTAQDFLVEATLRYGRIKSVTVKHSSPSFKTLPEILIDELEKHYSGIPETHVVLVAVNDNYSVYATPYAQGTPYASSSSLPQDDRQKTHSSSHR